MSGTGHHLIVKLQGGLGNQLFQYAFGRALEHRTGMAVTYDLSFFRQPAGEHVGRPLELDVFGITPPEADPELVARLQAGMTRTRRWGHRLFPALFPLPVCAETRPYTFDPTVLHPRTSTVYDGYWQTERYFDPVAAALRADLSFQRPLHPDNEAWAQEIEACTSVSLHVRRGDYTSHTAASNYFITCDAEHYQRCIAYLLERVPDARFFVFSDDPEWARAHIRTKAPLRFVEGNSGPRSPEDMRLMSLCRHHIIANSSFSWWGAWLDPRPDKLVVAPARWLRDPAIPMPDLLPPSWHRL